ncbi:hypothetical protein B6N60_02979 [Richelia sinica FACHB-800]|uniref:Uncharacterized protein n=1 Tax=Richelia sinica FACHB-800 TaxID=1357546 RepID=A0A975T9A1_9NOST|nr:hypothetical protein B6N60_02979 [Richelia sinica FACHB-800]
MARTTDARGTVSREYIFWKLPKPTSKIASSLLPKL